MKKYICFAAALAIVGAASCNKELVDNNAPEVPEVKIATLTATIGEPDTKTTLAAPEDAHTSGSAVHWAAEDALSVFGGESNVKYTIKTEEDVDYTPAATAVFEGTELAVAEGYYALYPYTESATLEEGVIKGAVLPAIQTAVAGNIPAGSALAVAYTEDRETINFKNVATIIGFTLTEAAEKVVFVAKGGEAIAGTIDVTINEGLPTYTVQEETGINKVTLNNLAAGTYYFTILPDVTLAQGYEFYIGEELAKSKADELTLVRSKVYSLGEVKVPLKDRELSFSPASYEITWGDDFTEPTLNGLTNTDQVTYSIESGDAATITPEGVVTLVKAGTVIIKATVAATDTHNEGSATYTLNIEKAVRTVSFSESSKTVTYGENVVHPVLNDVTESDNVSYEIVAGDAATINNEGVVTLVKAGTVTIKATVAATETHIECSATYVLIVKDVVYLVPNDNWKDANARFAAVFMTEDKSTQTWIDMTSDGDIYSCQVPDDDDYLYVIFCRMNPNNKDNKWDNKWDQTGDMSLKVNKYCVIPPFEWSGTMVWSDDKSVPFIEDGYYYLYPSDNWKEANARFAVYLCNGTSNAKWISMTAVGQGTNYYKVKIPTGENHKNIIFCRMNPSSATNDWSNKWTQTGDLDLKSGNVYQTINWDDGSWHTIK